MHSFHIKRRNRLSTRVRRYVAEIFQHLRSGQLQKKQQQQQEQYKSYAYVLKEQGFLLNRMLQFNQTFNQRLIFTLELYRKNILKRFNQKFYKIPKRQYQFVKVS